MMLTFIGSGDAFGSGGRLQTCFALTVDGRTLLIDCGATSVAGLRRAGLDPSTVDAIVLSHLHGDHFGGLPFLILDAQFSRRTRPLVVAGPPGVRARVEAAMEVFFPGSSVVARRFETVFVELPTAASVSVGPAVVTAFPVEHPSGATPFALRVTWAGKTVAYSGDTAWTETLVDVARAADLFVCECYTFDRKVRYHLDWTTLRAERSRLACRRLLLTHMGQDVLDHLGEIDVDHADDGKAIEV